MFNPQNTLNNEWPHLTGHEADSQSKTHLFKDTREQAGGRRPRLEGSNALPVHLLKHKGFCKLEHSQTFLIIFPISEH